MLQNGSKDTPVTLHFKKACLTAFLFVLVFSLNAQTRISVDKTLDSISNISGTSPDEGMNLIDSVIALYQERGNLYGYARSISLKSWFLVYKGQYEESLKLAHQALAEQKKLGTDSLGIGLTYNRIGLANLYFDRDENGLKYIRRALEIFTALKDTSNMDMALNNLGVIHTEAKNYAQALKFFKLVLKLRIPSNDHLWIGYAYENMGMGFRFMNELDSAEIYLSKAKDSFLKLGNEIPPNLYFEISELYKQKGQLTMAVSSAEKALQQSVQSEHIQLQMSSLKLLSTLHAEKGNYAQAYSFLKQFHSLKESIDSLNSSEAITEIEEKYENAEKAVEIANLKADKLEADSQIQQSKLLALYAMIALILGIAVFGYLYLKKVQRQKLQASELNAKIASTRLIALRAQMNPHFIFNCLNTTQNFIMASQKQQAYQYLSKFAKLLRQVLENSGETFIPLENEISQIKLYLELEKVRFDNKFAYEINIDPELEEGVYEIPGMIIQPIIENAILHGLINRNDSKGILNISISKKQQSAILCKIQDNGVGRKEAARIKKSKNVHYKSVAIPNVLERLKILTGNSTNIDMRVSDLHINEQASGTLVELTLPYQ